MENKVVKMQENYSIDQKQVDSVVLSFEKAIEKTLDITKETDKIISMTPKDGYQKKIELIISADDLSTDEKIKAIDEAEDKYFTNLDKSTEVCTNIFKIKVGALLICIAGAGFMFGTSKGRNVAKEVLKKVS